MLQDLELCHLYTVIVLGAEMHFTRASHRLNIAPPCSSKRIQRSERLHGAKMFEHHTIRGGKVYSYKRPDSTLWQCSSFLAGKNRR